MPNIMCYIKFKEIQLVWFMALIEPQSKKKWKLVKSNFYEGSSLAKKRISLFPMSKGKKNTRKRLLAWLILRFWLPHIDQAVHETSSYWPGCPWGWLAAWRNEIIKRLIVGILETERLIGNSLNHSWYKRCYAWSHLVFGTCLYNSLISVCQQEEVRSWPVCLSLYLFLCLSLCLSTGGG